MRWEKNIKGFMKVWANGELKFDFKGRTMREDSIYFRYGLYRSFISRYAYSRGITPQPVPGQKVYFANVKRGKTRNELLPYSDDK